MLLFFFYFFSSIEPPFFGETWIMDAVMSLFEEFSLPGG